MSLCFLVGLLIVELLAVPALKWTRHHESQKAPLMPDSLRRKDEKEKMCNLMQPLWDTASKLLDVQYENSGTTQHCEELYAFYLEGYPNHEPHRAYTEYQLYWFGDRELIYPVIFKNADRAIRWNLIQNAPDQVSVDEIADSFTDIPQVTIPEGSEVTVPLSQLTAFTYVREPAGRFVSAYSEIASRLFFDGSEATAMSSIKSLLAFSQSVSEGPWDHFKSQLAPLYRYTHAFGRPVDLVGTLEDFNSTWSEIEARAGRTFQPYNSSCGQHSSSDPQYPPRQQMERLVFENQTVKYALGCAVLLPDYVCLRYDHLVSPEECQQFGFDEATDLQWDEILKQIRDIFCPDPLNISA